jgi:hypothetical protein
MLAMGKFLDSPFQLFWFKKINFSAKKLKNLEPSGTFQTLSEIISQLKFLSPQGLRPSKKTYK